LRQVKLTRSPALIDFRLATALPSTGRVTDSAAVAEEEDDVLPATGRTVIVLDDSSAAITSAVTLADCLPDWLLLLLALDLSVARSDEPDIEPPLEVDPLPAEPDVVEDPVS